MAELPKDMIFHFHSEDGITIKFDAIPLVRCGECKHYLKSSDECGIIETTLQFYAERKRWTEDSFCSWGEREVQE